MCVLFLITPSCNANYLAAFDFDLLYHLPNVVFDLSSSGYTGILSGNVRLFSTHLEISLSFRLLLKRWIWAPRVCFTFHAQSQRILTEWILRVFRCKMPLLGLTRLQNQDWRTFCSDSGCLAAVEPGRRWILNTCSRNQSFTVHRRSFCIVLSAGAVVAHRQCVFILSLH